MKQREQHRYFPNFLAPYMMYLNTKTRISSYPDYRIGVAFGAAPVFIPPVAAVTFNIVLWVKHDLTLCLQHV